jgi:hypothetical protein
MRPSVTWSFIAWTWLNNALAWSRCNWFTRRWCSNTRGGRSMSRERVIPGGSWRRLVGGAAAAYGARSQRGRKPLSRDADAEVPFLAGGSFVVPPTTTSGTPSTRMSAAACAPPSTSALVLLNGSGMPFPGFYRTVQGDGTAYFRRRPGFCTNSEASSCAVFQGLQ